jgi:hypothetical protein
VYGPIPPGHHVLSPVVLPCICRQSPLISSGPQPGGGSPVLVLAQVVVKVAVMAASVLELAFRGSGRILKSGYLEISAQTSSSG